MAGQLWATGSLGGFLSNYNLSKVFRTSLQPLTKARQFADIKDFVGHGKGHGQTVTWDLGSDVATQGTRLVETATVPVTNMTMSQGTGTVFEYGNSVPYTGLLEAMSEFDVEAIINRSLKNDCKRALDQMCFDAFNATPLRVNPTGGTSTSAIVLNTTGTASSTSSVALGKLHVTAIADLMMERNVPPYVDDDYVGMMHPSTLRPLLSQLEAVQQYTPKGFEMIMNGEAGRYDAVRFVRQTSIAKETFAAGASNWAMFFGQETIAEAIVNPEEIRAGIPTDLGRSKRIGWYYLGNAVMPRATLASQTTVFKWDSLG